MGLHVCVCTPVSSTSKPYPVHVYTPYTPLEALQIEFP